MGVRKRENHRENSNFIEKRIKRAGVKGGETKNVKGNSISVRKLYLTKIEEKLSPVRTPLFHPFSSVASFFKSTVEIFRSLRENECLFFPRFLLFFVEPSQNGYLSSLILKKNSRRKSCRWHAEVFDAFSQSRRNCLNEVRDSLSNEFSSGAKREFEPKLIFFVVASWQSHVAVSIWNFFQILWR